MPIRLPLTVTETEHDGPTGSVTVDLTGAVFKTGSLQSAAAPGVLQEIYAERTPSGWVAKVVDLESAPS